MSPRIRPFADFLHDHNSGLGANEAGEELHKLVAAVRDTGKKGTVTLRVTVSALDEDTLVTMIDVTSALPKQQAKTAVFFADEDGNLTREDPRQTHLALREIPGGKGVEVDTAALKEAGA